MAYGYDDAFARNIGIVGEREQLILRGSTVAIAGLGGVGGLHLATLARMGIGRFTIADPDVFEPANINRQYGATASAMGRNKAEVMAEIAREINPALELKLLKEGVRDDNIAGFLDGADVLVDGLDIFALETRRSVFREARSRGLHVVSAGPLGFGAILLIFSPTGMTFDDYCGIDDAMSPMEQFAAFAVALAPTGWHLEYMDLSKVSVAEQRGPSIASACALCSGLLATETLNILLKRRPIPAAPEYRHFDPYLERYKKGRVLFGGRNPLQILRRRLLLRRLERS